MPFKNKTDLKGLREEFFVNKKKYSGEVLMIRVFRNQLNRVFFFYFSTFV